MCLGTTIEICEKCSNRKTTTLFSESLNSLKTKISLRKKRRKERKAALAVEQH